jgi:hypothetical protein
VYKISRLNAAESEGTQLDVLQDAALEALQQSRERPSAVIGLWRIDDNAGASECLAIAHDGEIYWK